MTTGYAITYVPTGARLATVFESSSGAERFLKVTRPGAPLAEYSIDPVPWPEPGVDYCGCTLTIVKNDRCRRCGLPVHAALPSPIPGALS